MNIRIFRRKIRQGTGALGAVVGVLALFLIVSLATFVPRASGGTKDWPDVPTTIEAGLPSVDTVLWVGLSGPPGLPATIVNILDNATREALSDPEVIANLDKIGILPWYMSGSGDAFRRFVLDEANTIKSLKLK